MEMSHVSMNAVSSSINVKISVHVIISVKMDVMIVVTIRVLALILKRTLTILNVLNKEMASTLPVSINARLAT